MSDPLLEELGIVQNAYLSLLKELDKIPEDKISLAMIDAVNIFWYENRNIVKLVFEYPLKDKNTYSFSAATIFDVDDKDQYSLFLLGDYHVFDDPIPSYLNIKDSITDEVYLEKMRKIISKTIKDNIRIIEELNGNLIILPLRYVSVILNQHYEKLDEMAERLFCNLFTTIESIEEYKEKIVTSEDLIQYLDDHNSRSILLSDSDNPSEDWDHRIQSYKKTNDNFNMELFTSGDVFFLAVFSSLRQALALVDMSSTFKVIPFIRSFIPFHYYYLLSSMFKHNLQLDSKVNSEESYYLKTKVSYFLYREFRKRDNSDSLEELKQKAVNISFENKIFSGLDGLTSEKEVNEVLHVVNKYLDELE